MELQPDQRFGGTVVITGVSLTCTSKVKFGGVTATPEDFGPLDRPAVYASDLQLDPTDECYGDITSTRQLSKMKEPRRCPTPPLLGRETSVITLRYPEPQRTFPANGVDLERMMLIARVGVGRDV
jgi:hypothetical protein